MSLYDKMLSAINSKAVITNKGTGDVYAAKACERIAIESQIELLRKLSSKEGMNSNLLGRYIEGLESKLKQD